MLFIFVDNKNLVLTIVKYCIVISSCEVIHPENPYVEYPHDVRCVSFSPNGDVLDGNVYKTDIMWILAKHRPF